MEQFTLSRINGAEITPADPSQQHHPEARGTWQVFRFTVNGGTVHKNSHDWLPGANLAEARAYETECNARAKFWGCFSNGDGTLEEGDTWYRVFRVV